MLTSLLARFSLLAVLTALALPAGADAAPAVTGPALDHSFGGGSVNLPFRGPGTSQNATSCVSLPNGGVVVHAQSGKYVFNDESSLPYISPKGGYLYAFNGAGQRLASFGQDGVVALGADPINTPAQVDSDPQGRIYVLAREHVSRSKQRQFILRRLTARGNIDRRFGHGRIRINAAVKNLGVTFELMPDGRVAIVERRSSKKSGGFGLIRMLRRDGSPDNGFDRDGKITVPLHVDLIRGLPHGELAVGGSDDYPESSGVLTEARVISKSGKPSVKRGDGGRITFSQPPANVQREIDGPSSSMSEPSLTNFLWITDIAATPNHGLSFALESSIRDGGFRWFATFRGNSESLDAKASHFLDDASGVDDGTSLDTQVYWSLPDGAGGWANVTFQNTGNAALWASRVSSGGKSVSTSARQTDFRAGTDVFNTSLIPGTRTLLGCGWQDIGSWGKARMRAFVFKMRLK